MALGKKYPSDGGVAIASGQTKDALSRSPFPFASRNKLPLRIAGAFVAVAVGVLVGVTVLVGNGVLVGCGVAVASGVLVGAGVAVGAAVQATSRMNGIRMRMNVRDILDSPPI